MVRQCLFRAAEHLSHTSLRLDIQIASEEPFSSTPSIGGSYKPTLNPYTTSRSYADPGQVTGNAQPLKNPSLDTIHCVQRNSTALRYI